jgi:glycosyltransferase involved in cell wall biosynthesis
VAGTVEVLDDNTGVLVPPGDVEALCGAVVNLCRDPQLRKRIGANARLLAERKYSWQRLAEVFVDACIQAVTRRQGLLKRKLAGHMDSV